MQVTSDRDEMIFRKDYDNRASYSIGLSKKDQNGNYINGYITAAFKKDVELENKTKIKIKEAWLGFNVKDKKTYPHIFINDFDIVDQPKQQEQNPFEQFGDNIKTESDIGQFIEITDEDLPF